MSKKALELQRSGVLSLFVYRANGRVDAIPTYRVYQLYDVYTDWTSQENTCVNTGNSRH